jgi:hypothetical protein
MRRSISIFAACFFFLFGVTLFAQEEEGQDPPTIESDWDDFIITPYSPGDKTIVISLGLLFPVLFGGVDGNQHGISLGGTGSLAFNYFFTPHFFLGGEISGMFASSRRGNMLYIVPFGVRAGYQFWYSRFEFPISILIGAAPEKYLDKGYFGLALKPAASAFWRFNPEFSFGINAVWWVIPQWPKNNYDAYGNFLELTLSARYHF